MPDEQKGCGDLKQAGAYATYMYHARESQILLADQCSELRRLWVKTLKLFGGSLREICLLSPRDNDDRLCRLGGLHYLCKVDQGIPYDLGPHRHLDRGVVYGRRSAFLYRHIMSNSFWCCHGPNYDQKHNNGNI